MKQDINILLAISFIHHVEHATCMAITNSGSNKKEWEAQNLCGFQKTECNNKEGSFSITIYRLSTKHNGRVPCIFSSGWIFQVSSNIHSSKRQIQNNVYHKLVSVYLEGDVFQNEKMTSNILKNYDKSIQRIFGQFHENILR